MYGQVPSPRARPTSAYYSPRMSARPGPLVSLAPTMSPRFNEPAAPSPRPSSPRSFRPLSAPMRPMSAYSRAGGRLYVQSPLTGMTENEMINEAKLRIAHNKQRQQLKALLANAADGGSVVNTRDLLLACRIAKLDVGTEYEQEIDKFVHPKHVADRDCYGVPSAVNWKGFHKSLEYPQLHGPGQFPGELPLTRAQQRQFQEYKEELQEVEAAGAEEADNGLALKARDEDVRHYHKLLKRALETRFAEIRRAYRLIDEDNSGQCDRDELKNMLQAMFNLNIPDHIMDRIIDLADYDGDGQINFAEFARLATEDDILNMKQTLQADVGNWGACDVQAKLEEISKQKLAAQRRAAQQGGYEDGGYHPKLRRTGPSLDELRRAHRTIKKAVLLRFPDFQSAFKHMDRDGSGTLRRAELRNFLQQMVKTISDRIISGLIDFCDDDGDGKTLSMGEFCKLMRAEYLGSGGFDPNADNRFGRSGAPTKR